MEKPFKKTCWPDRREGLLLQAGLAELPQALTAWGEFCRVAPEELSRDELRLVPLVAAHLKDHGPELPRGDFLRKSLRESWLHLQQLFYLTMPALAYLKSCGVDFLVLKGAALAVQYYPHPGTRPMADLDLLVHPADLRRSADLLAEKGWRAARELSGRQWLDLIRFRHEMTFHHPLRPSLDLHWHLVEEARFPAVEALFWQDAVPCLLPGLRSKTLEPADQFLHACLHGVRWNEVSPVRWLADAVLIARGGLNWRRLEEQARRLELVEPVRATLCCLADLGLNLPQEQLEHWRGLPITRRERWERAYRTAQPSRADRTRQLALAYLRLQRGSTRPFWRELFSYLAQLHHFRSFSRRVKFLLFIFFYRLIKLSE